MKLFQKNGKLLVSATHRKTGTEIETEIIGEFCHNMTDGTKTYWLKPIKPIEIKGIVDDILSINCGEKEYRETQLFFSQKREEERREIISKNESFFGKVDAFIKSKTWKKVRKKLDEAADMNDEYLYREYKKEADRIIKKISDSIVIPSTKYNCALGWCGKEFALKVLMEAYCEKNKLEYFSFDELSYCNDNILREKIQFEIIKKHRHVEPRGGENGVDGYIDIEMKHENGSIVRVVYRDVFDFGTYGYPKRVEGTDDVFKEETWSQEEKDAIYYIEKNIARWPLRM